MNKKLFLFRHAEALEAASKEKDRDRELSGKGVSHSHQMGVYLSENLLSPEIIFSSPANRAIQTATITGDVLKLDATRIVADDELYNASVRSLFEFIQRIDEAYADVMCVGHNPAISYLAEYLAGEAIGDMSPCGLVIILFENAKWNEVSQNSGTLLHYLTPESIAKS